MFHDDRVAALGGHFLQHGVEALHQAADGLAFVGDQPDKTFGGGLADDAGDVLGGCRGVAAALLGQRLQHAQGHRAALAVFGHRFGDGGFQPRQRGARVGEVDLPAQPRQREKVHLVGRQPLARDALPHRRATGLGVTLVDEGAPRVARR